VDVDELRSLLTEEVIKRELIDGEEAKSAAVFLKKMQRRLSSKRNGSDDREPGDSASQEVPAIDPANASGSQTTTASSGKPQT
jgi:hypothetical protein